MCNFVQTLLYKVLYQWFLNREAQEVYKGGVRDDKLLSCSYIHLNNDILVAIK